MYTNYYYSYIVILILRMQRRTNTLTSRRTILGDRGSDLTSVSIRENAQHLYIIHYTSYENVTGCKLVTASGEAAIFTRVITGSPD